MPSLAESIQRELKAILAFVGVIWVAFLLSRVLPLDKYGLQPRSLRGLAGIVTMPFLHAGWSHIIANTIPLVVLLILLAGSRARSWEIVLEITLLGGLLLWLFGRPGNHIGASGLICGLIAFLVLGGVFERRFIPIVVAIITLALYGGSLLWGLVPAGPHISWDGHLCGAVAGGLMVFRVARSSKRQDAPPT